MPRTEIVGLGIRSTFTSLERVSDKPFKVVFVPQNATIYDDPDFNVTIEITTFDSRTGRRVGCRSTHTGRPTGKFPEYSCGMKLPPLDMVASVTVTTSQSARWGLDLIEADERAPRPPVQIPASIAFVEFDYAENTTAATSLAVTGVTCSAGDFLLALAAVFNTSGSTMTVSDPTNGTWTVPTGSPVLPDANSQGHIQYFTNAAELSAATVTLNPTGTSSQVDAVICRISGAAAAGFDQYVENTGAYVQDIGATATVTTGTLAQAANLVFTVLTHTGGTAGFTEHAAYTLIAEDTNNATEQAFHTQRITVATAATTAVTPTVAIASIGSGDAATWGIAAIVVKEAAAAADDEEESFAGRRSVGVP